MAAQEMTLQGVRCQSKEEFNYGKALEFWGFEYKFQVPFRGGRSVRGGYVLDFLVDTGAKSTPVSIKGSYWHKAKKAIDDVINEMDLANRDEFFPLITVEGRDMELCASIEGAKTLTKRHFLI